jgi:hypothetical protein
MVDFKQFAQKVKEKAVSKYQAYKEQRAKDVLEREKEKIHYGEIAEQERVAERELTEKLRKEEHEKSVLKKESEIREQVRREEAVKRQGGTLKVLGREALSYLKEKSIEAYEKEKRRIARSGHRRHHRKRKMRHRYG